MRYIPLKLVRSLDVADKGSLWTTESIETLVRVPNKRQTHLRAHVVALSGRLRAKHCTRVRLWDFVNREVLRVDVGLEFRFERSADATEAVPLHAAEEGVLFNLVTAADAAEAVL